MLPIRLFKGENSFNELKEGIHFIFGAIFIGIFSIFSAIYGSYLANKSYWGGGFDFGGFIIDGMTGIIFEILGWGLFFGAILLGIIVMKEKANWKEITTLLGLIAMINLVLGIVGLVFSKVDFIANLTYQVEAVLPFLLIFMFFLLKSRTAHKPLIAVIVVLAVSVVVFDIINTNPIHFGGGIESVSGYLEDIFG